MVTGVGGRVLLSWTKFFLFIDARLILFTYYNIIIVLVDS